ncbi:hypothetical protein BKA67DRAFT_557350 [Truncatella angustata]|uniref:Uncharacterized protein n=1 Tax=Truncatella angustata TaxID=152316 RepID=A0A9P8UTY9_9PEZI|nr:uncharacterized protein BKA67DRAFT_557350 [Truncatella angustata]KAH6658178.1 hypothetical protein BKA67DRAFT_557350 [Truncatella angustata]
MPQLRFISVEGRDGKASKLTSSVRSHAIRAGLRKTTHPRRVKTAAEQSYRSAKCRDDLMAHFKFPEEFQSLTGLSGPGNASARLALQECRTAHTNSVPQTFVETSTQLRAYHIQAVCAGSIDPFNSLPIPTNPEVDCLIKYLITKFGLNLATVDRRKSWFPYALQNAPMMHSTLAMTAALWRAEHSALEYSIQVEGIHQKGEAMREIRTKLAHAESVGNDDDMNFLMATMSTLGIVETCDGDFEAAETHLRGVQDLFSSRGGHDSLKDDFVLCKSINLADIQVAVALGHRLKFPLLHTDQAYLPASIIEQAWYPPLDHSILNDSSYYHVRIFVQIRQLLLARQSSVVSLDALRTLLNMADDAILRHLYQDSTDVSDASRRSRALVLAAHVFTYVTLRQVPPSSPLVRRMCARLQSIVGLTSSAREIWTENMAALLWVAFVGLLGMGTGTGAKTPPGGQWFLALFQCTVQRHPQGCSPGDGSIRRLLSSFLWDELCCQPLLAGLEERLGQAL